MAVHSFRPDGNGTISNWSGSYSDIDDDPDSPNEADSVHSLPVRSANSAFYTLTVAPSDFLSASSIAVKFRAKATDSNSVNLYAQLFKSDESTELTSAGSTVLSSTSYSTVEVSLPIIGTPSKADFDGARLKIWSDLDISAYPYRWEVVPWITWPANSGMVFARTLRSAGLTAGAGYVSTGSADDGDSVTFYVPMAAGTWKMSWGYISANYCGIFDITIDGVNVGTVDMYSNFTVDNVFAEISNISLATSAVRTVTFTANGKNASSSDYQWNGTLLSFARTDSVLGSFGSDLLPRHLDGIGFGLQNSGSGTVTRTFNGSCQLNGYGSTSSLNDYRDFVVPLEAGTYTLSVLYSKDTDGGVITPSLGGTNLTTIDTYGTASYNNSYTESAISVGSAGYKTLKFTTSSKNGSSSGYVARIQGWSLKRTDATSQVAAVHYEDKQIDIVPQIAAWDATTGGSQTERYQGTSSYGGGFVYRGPTYADDGHTYSWYVTLKAGTYRIYWMHDIGNVCGKFDITLGGSSVASGVDNYNASNSNNSLNSYSGIVVAADGTYELKFTTNGKNTSSTDYQFSTQWIQFLKTA